MPSGLTGAVLATAVLALGPAQVSHEPLIGHWRSVALEGRHLDDQHVQSMDVVFTEREMTLLTFMRDESGAEVDIKQAPYSIANGRLRIHATSSVSAGSLRYRLDGALLILDWTIGGAQGDVRMVFDRVP